MQPLYLKEENGRLYPCYRDGETIKGVTHSKIAITSGSLTEVTMTFYPAGLIRHDGSVVTGIINGYLTPNEEIQELEESNGTNQKGCDGGAGYCDRQNRY